MTKHYQDHATREDKERYMRQLPDFLGSSTATLPQFPDDSNAVERAELHRLVDTLSPRRYPRNSEKT